MPTSRVRSLYPDLPEDIIKRIELLDEGKFLVGFGERTEQREIKDINDVLLAERGILTAMLAGKLNTLLREHVNADCIAPAIMRLLRSRRNYAAATGSEAEL